MAEHIGVAKETVSRWENGVSRPQPNQLRKLCEAFDRSPESLGYAIKHPPEVPIKEEQRPFVPDSTPLDATYEPDAHHEQLVHIEEEVPLSHEVAQPSRTRRRLVAGLALGGLTSGVMFTWLSFAKPTTAFWLTHLTSSPVRRWPKVVYDLHQRLASVRVVQWMLKAHLYDIGPTGVDGIFGPNTQAALIAFQESQHLQESGKVEGPTWELLIVPSHPGSYGSQVIALQERLQALNLLPEQSIDDDFDPQTEKAVRAYQRKMHIEQKDEADLDTWCLLIGGILAQ